MVAFANIQVPHGDYSHVSMYFCTYHVRDGNGLKTHQNLLWVSNLIVVKMGTDSKTIQVLIDENHFLNFDTHIV